MKARNIAWLIVGTVALAIAATMYVRISNAGIMHIDVDAATFPVRGVDISAHNGHVDFERLRDAGVDFVYIKATEGATWRDSLYEHNYRAAIDAGLTVGVYHFFRFNVEGWRQSVNILRATRNRRIDLPIAIDVEEWGNPGEYAAEDIISNLRSMVELLRQGGREVIIYTNKNGYYRYIRGHFDDVALWICSFTNPPIRERKRWTLWQHSHIGAIDGIRGNADFNTFNSPALGDFNDYLRSHPGISSINF